jgi:peptide/nickel transport system permease protein
VPVFRLGASNTFRWWSRHLNVSRFALALVAAICLIALAGPIVARYSPTELAAQPYASPSAHFPLGTDFLGRDVLSRLLWGGRVLMALAALATLLAYLVGGTIGLVAGYSHSWPDAILMRSMDILLAFPAVLFLLILTTGIGTGVTTLLLGITLVQIPGIARVVRSATLQVAVRGYVEAAIVRGDSLYRVVTRELLPNIRGTIAADLGPRLTISILLVATLNYLGLGLQPPTADWALMMGENRSGLTIQPWAVVAPAVFIALLTVSLNICLSAFSRYEGYLLPARLRRQ